MAKSAKRRIRDEYNEAMAEPGDDPVAEHYGDVENYDPKKKSAVIRFFEDANKRCRTSNPLFYQDGFFAGTEILLYAVRQGRLRWQQLASLMDSKFDYSGVYRDFDDLQAATQYMHFSDMDYSRNRFVGCLMPHAVTHFIHRLDVTTKAMAGMYPSSPWLGNPTLKGKSADYWKFWAYHAASCQESETAVVARSYEKKLWKHRSFKKELCALAKRMGKSNWYYERSSGLWIKKGREAGDPYVCIDDTDVFDGAQAFCEKWCVHRFGKRHEIGRRDHLFALAMRIAVMPANDNTGLQVFIPRYYCFGHIKRYSDRDFLRLKRSMDEVFDSVRGYDRPSTREMVDLAKKMMDALIKKGVPEDEARERVRKKLNWADSSMAGRVKAKSTKDVAKTKQAIKDLAVAYSNKAGKPILAK